MNIGTAYLSPTLHKSSPMFSNLLLLLFCPAIGVPLGLLGLRLNILVNVPYAQ
jgi:hypothetical protein